MDKNSQSMANLSPQEKRVLLTQLLKKKASQENFSYPLSYGQQALWFLYQNSKKNVAYNTAFATRICSHVDVPALQRAFQALLMRHPTLRTTFTTQNGKQVQEVHGYQKVYFEEKDASSWAREELNKQVIEAYQRPFDLEQGPVLHVNLFTRSEQDHILLLTVHHIVYDGWSLWVLLDELRVLYPAEVNGTQVSLPPLPLSYADYVRKQTDMLTSSVGENLWKYWQQQLAGELPVLNLPTDYPRPPVQTYQGASQTFELMEALTQRLRKFTQAEGTTLFVTLLAAFQVLLYRYSGQENILVGSATTGRGQPEFDKIVGYFVNPIVLRAELTATLTFKAFLEQVRRTVLAAIKHQDYPFPLLVKQLQPNRDPSRSPIFQVGFALQKPQQFGKITELFLPNETEVTVNFGGLKLAPFELAQQEGQFDLTLEMMEIKTSLFGVFKYNTDLFEAKTITRMIGHFKTLLEGMVSDSQQLISELPLLTEVEQHQLLVEWNDTQTQYPHDKCIHQLFENVVEQTPDAIALVFENQQLTYRELNTRANQLAHYLQNLGVKAEVLVGLCLERSLEMVIGLLGILKAGGAYVPLDPSYPQERLAFMLEDSQAQVLLTQQQLINKLSVRIQNRKVVCLDTDWQFISRANSENLISNVQSNNLVYVIYTSGSTGKPKGVLIEHQGLCNLAHAQIKLFRMQLGSRILQFASLNFDASIWEIVMALCSNATLCLGTTDSLKPGTDLTQQLHKQIITHVTLPPTALAVLPTNKKVPDLQYIIVAGETCSPNLATQWSKDRYFFNAYGPTESTVCATIFEYTEKDRTSLPIGRPIANTQIYLLDNHFHPVAVGVPGELHIGSVGLARGYLNRPDLTSEKFIPNPFSEEPGTRLYKTGDLARYLPDGNIEYIGRIDNQVKLRGFRIELGEIEALLNQHPNVQETVVIVQNKQTNNRCLVAYMVSDLIPERIPYKCKCLVEQNGKILKFHTKDISSGGVLIEGATTLEKGKDISLRIMLPGESETRWLKGKVAWSQPSAAGIQFELTSHEQTILDKSVKYLIETEGILKSVQRILTASLRHYLEKHLPHYMVPSHFVLLTALPVTPNGKINRRALPVPNESYSPTKEVMPQTAVEQTIARVWQEVLQINKISIHENFFELGGHSLLIAQVQVKLQDVLGQEIAIVELFEYPTIHALAQHFSQKQGLSASVSIQKRHQAVEKRQIARKACYDDIAIIGMSCRFPGANNIETFWQNLQNGIESISFFSKEELLSAGVDTTTLNHPNYVKASAVLSNNIELFDAEFFDFSPKEAEITDPQQRLFLECAWEAIESAGYQAGTDELVIGVYAGIGMDTYLLNNLYPNRDILSGTVGNYQLLIENDKDFLPTRVSYKLNLKGPSVNVQTACSTSLVAVHLACQSLLNGECDIALTGGVSIRIPHKTGYWYQEGMIHSPDGHCRAFDAKAQGIVGGNGVGIVVLKRLADAIKEADDIHAVIKGSAINNDGSTKVGYTAPSVEGQAAVIAEAQAIADIDPETITYIETHGTGTTLGDPIEVAALNKAFRASTQKKGFCAIGSVKTNIGHTDTAAGVAGLIKTVLALKHQWLPPSLHFEQPNPQIDFANSPFYVNTTLSKWQTRKGIPRRAGVSSFGIGGTNAHVILEEAPILAPSKKSRPWQVLVLSAKTLSALHTTTSNLAMYLEQHPDINFADVAYTLSKGRKTFSHRRMLVCQEINQATTALRTLEPTSIFTSFQEQKNSPVAFMFSGQGAQYVNMGLDLYQTESVFREQVDFCSEYLKPILGVDLRQVLYPHTLSPSGVSELNQTVLTQPALFVIEYALAKLWMKWGVHPEAMIGHSIGEYVAACLAGVFSLEEALSLVAARGQMMQQMPRGTMLSIPLAELEVLPLLGNELSLAAINTPTQCVVSGTTTAIEVLEKKLNERGVEYRRLHTSHAFHSEMMNPILESFTERVKQVQLNPPQIPYLSNLTGTWITIEEATDPNYWAKHLRHTVRFAEGIQHLLEEPARILLEIGPGRTLTTLAKQHPNRATEQVILSSLRHPQAQQSDIAFLLTSLGKLWLAGGSVNWSGFYAPERRHRLSLPTYPFERQRYWIDPPQRPQKTSEVLKTSEVSPPPLGKKPNIADWFYQPVWKQSVSPMLFGQEKLPKLRWLVFEDSCGLATQLVRTLEQQEQQEIMTVKIGSTFTNSQQSYILNPQKSEDYETLIKQLHTNNKLPQRIVHCWTVTHNEHPESSIDEFDKIQTLGFYSLLFLTQALGKQNVTEKIKITVVSNNMQEVTGGETLHPEKATILGSVKVIGQEYPNLHCRSIDMLISNSETRKEQKLINQLLAELTRQSTEQLIAYRGKYRWVQSFEPFRLSQPVQSIPRLKKKGVYLITGGLGGIGLVLAEHLAKTVQAKLILIGRTALPSREKWEAWLNVHEESDGISRKIKTIQILEAQGAEVVIISADVANQQQMKVAMNEAEQQLGSINGVIHAAGVPDGALILRQTREMTETVFASKVKGTLVLHNLLQNRKLDFFILCSSLASILGIGGQIGYCAANAFLDAFAHQENDRNDTLTVSINWDTWQKVGMAVEATAKPYRKIQVLPKGAKKVNHPLFDYCIVKNSEQEIYMTHFSLNKHWVLSEHRVMGNGILPGTAYLEMAKAAVEKYANNGTIELQQVYFLAPLQVNPNEEKEVWTFLSKQGEQDFEFSIKSRLLEAGENQWQEHAIGKIICITRNSPKRHNLKEIENRCPQEIFIPEGVSYQVGFVEFGPRWQNHLQQVKLGQKEGLVLLELSEKFADDFNSYQLHPALLDSAAGLANIDYFYPDWRQSQSGLATTPDFLQNEGIYYMPFSYQKLTIKGTIPRRFYSYVKFLENISSQTQVREVNLIIMDEQGTELLEINNYMLRQVELDKLASQSLEKPSAQTEQQSSLPIEVGAKDRNTVVTNVFQESLKEGILPEEGVEVFNRVLGSSLPQVLISTQHLQSRLEQDNIVTLLNSVEKAEPELSKPVYSRPQLSQAYVAPRNNLEQKLASIWQTFLGIEQVGIYDDFFELGGDSLLAVQLIAKLRDTLKMDFSAHSLLNSPTIAALVKSIEKTTTTDLSTQIIQPAFPSTLIEIQTGNSLKTPLFLMHPIGGSVYLYRELANFLGSEQPVYGLQAQGLEGEAEPLSRVEDMASFYIEAMRVRQPEGPYFLGGSSFGGMIAFEIAQQLHTLGQEVALLTMIDSPGPGQMPQKVKDDAEIFVYILKFGANISLSLDELRQLEADEQMLYAWEKGKDSMLLPPELNLSQLRHIFHVLKVNTQAMWDYKPRVYQGKVVFFRVQEWDGFTSPTPEKAWIDLAAGGIEIYEAPGNHLTVSMPPNVQVLAKKLKTYLA